MIEPQRVFREPVYAEVMQWGPSWAEMRAAAYWLADAGIPYKFDGQAVFDDDEEYGLPALTIYDSRWDFYVVRTGDKLVKYAQHDVRVVPRHDFTEEFTIINDDEE